MAICFLAVLVTTFDRFYYASEKPPSNIYTINEFEKWQPSYTKTDKVVFEGSSIFVVTGDFARSFPSAKAEYYFEQNGNFINWNKDPGDLVTLPIVRQGERLVSDINEIKK